jgi:hypothetical protein
VVTKGSEVHTFLEKVLGLPNTKPRMRCYRSQRRNIHLSEKANRAIKGPFEMSSSVLGEW